MGRSELCAFLLAVEVQGVFDTITRLPELLTRLLQISADLIQNEGIEPHLYHSYRSGSRLLSAQQMYPCKKHVSHVILDNGLLPKLTVWLRCRRAKSVYLLQLSMLASGYIMVAICA